MKPDINDSSDKIGIYSYKTPHVDILYERVKKAGFEIFDINFTPLNKEQLIQDQLANDEAPIIIKTKSPEAIIKITPPEPYKHNDPEDPYYSIALRPMEPYLKRECDGKEYIDLAAYLELYMRMTEGCYIEFMKSDGF